MTQLTRRNLLKKTSAGALIAGALAVVPGGAALAAGSHEVPEAEANMAGLAKATPFVAYVRNPKVGELVLIVGTEEITIHDKALVAKLWNLQSKRSNHAK